MNMFDHLYKKYPNLEDRINKIESMANDYFNELCKLDENYPVKGYYWSYDPNDSIIILGKEETEEKTKI